MKEINLNEISNLITSDNYYDEGKQVKCYLNGNEIFLLFGAIPIFKKNIKRRSQNDND